MKKDKISLFLDSGAFSAWSKGVDINIQEYIDFIKKHKKYIDVYANLDIIGNAKATLQNQKTMEKAGLLPLPCFHAGEDWNYLHYYVDNYSYIALGGVAQLKQTAQSWMDSCFNIICNSQDRMPKCKVHGFAVTSLRLMFRYPWYSVDSTSWVMTSRMGGVYVPQYKSGQWIYNENSWKISVSVRSPDKFEEGKHIDTFSKQQRQHILDYFSEKGYVLGKSKFEFVSKTHKLKKNERWTGSATGNKREIEVIVEPGLCNNYKLRDEMNIIYYLDLEKHMPKWPWSFKSKGVKGFNL